MEIIIKPIITEKMAEQGEKLHRYGFIVNEAANKLQIKKEVEKMYGVSVKDVNTSKYVGKIKMRNTTRGLAIGILNKCKKATVTLKKGDVIDFYAGRTDFLRNTTVFARCNDGFSNRIQKGSLSMVNMA